VKGRIQQAQTRAELAANAERVRLYWDIGRMIDNRQQQEGWGSGVIPRLAQEPRNELPEVKGFSERNFKRMLAFYRACPQAGGFMPQAVAQIEDREKVPQAVAQTEPILWSVPWGHHALLLEKVKEESERSCYMQQTLATAGVATC